jgi:ribosomal protein S18 acetylase RimI-like enzyme
LAYICAYQNDYLVGFVNVAWDGGDHAFLLDTTAHPTFQRRGIGQQLVRKAARVARAEEWHGCMSIMSRVWNISIGSADFNSHWLD